MSSPLLYQLNPNNFTNPVESTNCTWLFQQTGRDKPQCLELALRDDVRTIPITENEATTYLQTARKSLKDLGLQLKNVQSFSINKDLINIKVRDEEGGESKSREWSIETQAPILERVFTKTPEPTTSLAFRKLSIAECREKQVLSPLSYDKAEPRGLSVKPVTSKIDEEEITTMTTFARTLILSISQVPQGSPLIKASPTRAISPVKHVERTASYKLTISLSNQETDASLDLPIELWEESSSTLTGILNDLLRSSAKKFVLNGGNLAVTPDSFYLNGVEAGENDASTHWITEYFGDQLWQLNFKAERSEPLVISRFTTVPPETAIPVPVEAKT